MSGRLYRSQFSPERNHFSAYLTLFHAMPDDAMEEVLAGLVAACAANGASLHQPPFPWARRSAGGREPFALVHGEFPKVASVMCGCPQRVKVFGQGGGTESTGAVMCPASNATGMAAGPDELRGASA